MRNNQQVNSIQMLRGICALLIVWAHSYNWVDDVYPNMGKNLFSFAFVGVDIFFIISGFIITYVTENKKEQVATLFLIKRFFRVVPLAWVAMLFYGLASGYSISDLFNNSDFIKSLLFIPIDSSAQAPAYGYGFLIVTWTLIYEIIFYLIFSLSMLINGKYRSAICSVAIVSLVILLQYFSSDFVSLNTHEKLSLPDLSILTSIYGVLANPMMFYFIVGMILAEVYMIVPSKNNQIVGAMCLFIILLCLSYLTMVSIPYNRLITVGPWCAVIVMSMLIWEKIGGLKVPRVFIFLGSLTYSLYLFHIPIQMFFYSRRLPGFEFFYAGFSGFSKLFFFTFLSILISSCMFFTFEKFFIKLGRYFSNKLIYREEGKKT